MDARPQWHAHDGVLGQNSLPAQPIEQVSVVKGFVKADLPFQPSAGDGDDLANQFLGCLKVAGHWVLHPKSYAAVVDTTTNDDWFVQLNTNLVIEPAWTFVQ